MSGVWCQAVFGLVGFRERLTCKRREKGMQSWKVLFERKVLKNCGQEVVVKLFPRLVSKGRGSELTVGVAVARVESPAELVADDCVPVGMMLDGRVEVASCRAWRAIGRAGGSVRSKTRCSLPRKPAPYSSFARTAWQKKSRANRSEYNKHGGCHHDRVGTVARLRHSRG